MKAKKKKTNYNWKEIDDIMDTAIQVVGSDKVTTIEEFLTDSKHPMVMHSISFKPPVVNHVDKK